MLIIALVFYLMFPIIGVFLPIIFYFFDSQKNSLLYSLLIGLSLGIVAYYFVPPHTYDLYRHHLIIYKYVGQNWNYFLDSLQTINAEFFPLLLSYIVAKFNNVDIIQFVVTTIGYSIIFYIMYDYRKKSNINLFSFFIIVFFVFFGFNALNFISGLWNYIAIIIFSLALYFDYVKNEHKVLSYILYFISIFFHSAMFFPLVILLIYKFFKNKLSFKTVILCISICVFPVIILNLINNYINIDIFKTIEQLYNSYFKNNYMYNFYGGIVLFIEMTKLFITLICTFFQEKKERFEGIYGLIILLTLCVLVALPQSIVMIRFVMLIQFIGIIPIINYFKKINRKNILILLIMIILSAIYIIYFYKLFINQNFGLLFGDKLLDNIITIFRK